MREIKFRAKDVETSEWRYGYYCQHKTKTLAPIGTTKQDEADNIKHYIIWDGFSDWNMVKPHYRSEVNSKTVGEFTGLKDKNGVEIFEGDRVCIADRPAKTGTVEWYNGCLYVQGDDGWLQEFMSDPEGDGSAVEVIGNIYETPELMK